MGLFNEREQREQREHIAHEHADPVREVEDRVERECDQPISKMETFTKLKNDMEGLRDLQDGQENLEIIKAVAGASPKHSMQTFEAEKQKLEAKQEQKVVPDYKQGIQDIMQSQEKVHDLDVSESNSFGVKPS
ncbi:TPA: hypothetical protein ACPSKZ_001848 [Legionella anisa]|uniref:hypothetical protein n=1 Tax=Legionella anisa TaxID=28082 RepID=UPI0003498CC6|nr:hypothetical protein [Legionella anisa]AWN75386.1 hypothetical protein DLD14_16940 [Legionella anisa]MCW8424434.1 hypothetical protein [Legionella anisa]MCW8446448.1 hypothetical protein [Legionella anisa]